MTELVEAVLIMSGIFGLLRGFQAYGRKKRLQEEETYPKFPAYVKSIGRVLGVMTAFGTT